MRISVGSSIHLHNAPRLMKYLRIGRVGSSTTLIRKPLRRPQVTSMDFEFATLYTLPHCLPRNAEFASLFPPWADSPAVPAPRCLLAILP